MHGSWCVIKVLSGYFYLLLFLEFIMGLLIGALLN
jgi:hypothetical protein